MKKVLPLFICLVIISVVFTNNLSIKSSSDSIQSTLEGKLIRFHVIANSDTVYDQNLKLKVRDKVLEYISPKLKNSKSLDESRKIIKDNDEKIRQIAAEVIKSADYDYTVKTTLSKEKFPIKTYGNITLPQGEYEAYRIIIGSGKGQNWWCVMFPPLCFIDITKGNVSYKETEKSMKQVLSEKEYEAIDNTGENITSKINKSKDEEIIINFKIIELFKDIFK